MLDIAITPKPEKRLRVFDKLAAGEAYTYRYNLPEYFLSSCGIENFKVNYLF